MTKTFLQHQGDSYKNFLVRQASWIEELDCLFREIEHLPTGATILHLETKDPENVFCLSLQTLPNDSKGAPHILEHTVLCGSEQFPVKDPFFSMTRRSLNTFMNAFTGSDFTCYPAATQIEQDFYNLLSVYLDAVFHPKLEKESFWQEGCRLAFQDGLSSPLLYKGVVYNEMKGARSSCDARMWHLILKELFSNLPYRHDSGGDPHHIPELSYEELCAFHKTFYHPSRCLFFFSGNLSLKKHLDFLEKHAFAQVTKLPPLSPLLRQERYISPRKLKASYPSHVEEGSTIAFAWLTCPLINQEEVLALSVLDSILTDTDASPLKLALLESGLCSQAGGFLDAEMSEVPYVFVCKGCKASDDDAIEELLLNTLEHLSKQPLPEAWIEAALHQFELSHMEISGDHGPFGLTLFFRAGLAKQHGCNPETNLKLHESFSSLRKKLQDPYFLPSLIRKYFVVNTHMVRVTMIPDQDLEAKERQEEQEHLHRIKHTLTPTKVKEILIVEERLQQRDLQENDLSCLPKLSLHDIPSASRDFALSIVSQPSYTLFHHDCFTNHMLYATMSFSLPELSLQELPYLQLLLSILPELGAGSRDYKAQLEELHTYTGGLSLHASWHAPVENPHVLRPHILLRGKALERNAKHLLSLMHDTLTAPHLHDEKRITDLLGQIRTTLQNKIQKHALRYAIQLALSGYTTASLIANTCLGLPYYTFIQEIKEGPHLIDKLLELYERLFSFHAPELILSCNTKTAQEITRYDLSFPQKPHVFWSNTLSTSPIVSQGYRIPSPVAYNVQSHLVSTYLHPHAPALTLATQVLENKILHAKIREQGGAYGASATYISSTGCFYLHSYRDPHIHQTFAVFQEAIAFLRAHEVSSQDLEEAKFGILQHIDAPVMPSGRAMLAYEWYKDGKTLVRRQAYRDQILSLSSQQLRATLEQEFTQTKDNVQISFAGKDQFAQELPSLPSSFIVRSL